MANKIIIKQREAKTITLIVTDANDSAVDLSGATLFMAAKRDKSELAYIFSKGDGDFDKGQAASGIVAVDLSAADTDQPEAIYIGELKCSWPGPVIEKSQDFFLQVKRAVTA